MTLKFINDGARRLEPYSPGLSIENARRRYQREDFIKMASNENAYGPCPAALEVLAQPWVVERYPDPDQRRLGEALAEKHGLAPGNIVVGAGSSELLDRIARLLLAPGKTAVFSQYAFSLYRQYTLNCGAEPIEVPAHPPGHPQAFGHDLEAMAAAIDERCALVYIASPNNPTGTYTREAELRALIEKAPQDTIVVIDQAYAEYARAIVDDYPALLDWHQARPNLMLTRTFSKIHALAGLRVGYAIASEELADWLRRIRQPFNVSQLGQEAALAAMADSGHADRCAEDNRGALATLSDELALLGLEPIPSAANFIAMHTPIAAAELYERLMARGIIARTLAEYGLERHLRLTIGRPEENQRALHALQDSLADD